MNTEVSLNIPQSLYVIPCGEGFTCFGFDNARRDTEHIGTTLKRQDLMPTTEDYGSLAGYAKYKLACTAWAASVLSKETWFTRATDKKVKQQLESFRESGKMVRLFYGDRATGRDWCDEFDVVGRIGRSGGSQKVPLMIAQGERGGSAILTESIIRMMDVEWDCDVYRHPSYRVTEYRVEPLADAKFPEYKWAAFEDGKGVVARFCEGSEAFEWRDFMTGKIAAKREHVQAALRAA